MPEDHAPWLSMIGLPIVDGATGLIADEEITPVRFNANGSRSVHSEVFTGTFSGEWGGFDCNGWTSAKLSSTYSFTTDMDESLFGAGDGAVDVLHCMDELSLLCLQVKGSFFGPNTLHLVQGKRAFVSQGKLFGAMSFNGKTGVAAADALCQSEAAAVNYENSANFHAYLSTSNVDAICHILGVNGKLANQCGLTALPTTDPWRRADDFPIATAADLVGLDGRLLAPLWLRADQTRTFNLEQPWTGTDPTDGSADNCKDWTTSSGASVAVAGFTSSVGTHWAFDIRNANCGAMSSVYCFEQ